MFEIEVIQRHPSFSPSIARSHVKLLERYDIIRDNIIWSVHRACLEHFSDEGGYFDVVVRPMLQQGHEGELCSWLKEMSLIRTVSSCPHLDCKGRSLAWNPARIVDKYSWSCPNCQRKQSIRDSSFFLGIKCDLKMCLQLILGWCQRIPCEIVASHLGIYRRCTAQGIPWQCYRISSLMYTPKDSYILRQYMFLRILTHRHVSGKKQDYPFVSVWLWNSCKICGICKLSVQGTARLQRGKMITSDRQLVRQHSCCVHTSGGTYIGSFFFLRNMSTHKCSTGQIISLYHSPCADVKKHVVRKIYERCDEVSAVYVEKHPEDWLLGGESAILIVDEFPSGYMTEHQPDVNCARKRNNNSHTIICIAEVNTVPTRIWLHMIEAVPEVYTG